MTTLKIGTKGEEVKRLQRLLHLTSTHPATHAGHHRGSPYIADGLFGPATEAAVKEYQNTHGLVADGIVGDKTWESLLNGVIDIKKAFINTHITGIKNRKVKYIAVHFTAGGTSKAGTAAATKNVFLSRRASADFVVDDETIVQINPNLNTYYTWGVGDKKNPYSGGGTLYGMATNRNTVSIEICSNLKKGYDSEYPNHEGWYFTEASLKNALKLIRYLMQMFGLSKYAVVRHYDVSGKLCPGIVGWNDGMIYSNDGKPIKQNNSDQWKKFWAQI